MAEDKKGKNPSRALLFVLGWGLLIVGITLVLVWWSEVVQLFKGGMGIGLALIGMLVLYSLKH